MSISHYHLFCQRFDTSLHYLDCTKKTNTLIYVYINRYNKYGCYIYVPFLFPTNQGTKPGDFIGVMQG